jgi:hypothetical protein
MKADLTRDTFHPFKHFDRVLMQQGRVQLDADWNEQAAILLHYLQTLAADLIGPAGGPSQNAGFKISQLPGSTAADFQIGFGDYYVDGLLCQADFIPIAIFPTTNPPVTVFRVMNWNSAFELTPIPPFEVFDDTPGTNNPPVSVQLSNPQKASNQITIGPAATVTTFSAFANPKLRRLITYLTQPDYITPLPLPPVTGGQTFLEIYLDVWERVITYAEDDGIREVALGGPDTAARSKLVWQVKFMPGSEVCMDSPTFFLNLIPNPNRGWLQAMAKQGSPSTDPCIINPNASYTGPENQLYRVEINRGGAAWDGKDPGNTNAATFKWSRENGSVIYPIVSPITTGGGTTTVVVENLGRDDRFGLEQGDLVEVEDDRSVLLNEAGTLLQVQSIDPSTLTVGLNGTPLDPVIGSNEAWHPLLRRWDQAAGDPAEGGLTLANDNAAFVQEGVGVWLNLEDGVQISFQPASSVSPATGQSVPNRYRTGDYWLIPARTATGDVEWPKVIGTDGNPETDAQGNPIPVALPPHGVNHHYAPLAVINVNANGVNVPNDCRSGFPPASSPVADMKKG